MNKGQRQVIAEKVSSTIRFLELLQFKDYEVRAPKNQREKGNKSPRVICVNVGKSKPLTIYNGTRGNTWAYLPSGQPVPGVHRIEELYEYLSKLKKS